MKSIKFGLLGALLAMMAHVANAGEVNAAVAANFTEPVKLIAEQFQKDTGHTVKFSFGSSGKFYSQIKEGAPFDVFLAADEKNPKLLEEEGLAVKDTRFVYALGKLVLWSTQPGFVDNKGAVLGKGSYNKIAYADPKLAPYGLAAQETLQKMKLWDKVQGKLVTGESIAQTYQFAATGNAEMAFIALSQITRDGKIMDGSYWIVPADSYSPIKQAAVQLAAAKDKAAAQAFLKYLKGEKAQGIIRNFGYGLP
jgi:molybdate transport system substrate-binding protein